MSSFIQRISEGAGRMTKLAQRRMLYIFSVKVFRNKIVKLDIKLINVLEGRQ